jgi:hypothetical protein
MALDSTIALISVDEAKVLLNINSSLDENAKARIEMLINLSSGLIASRTGRKFITPANAITEYFFGHNTCEHYLDNKPIVGTPTSLQYHSSGTTWYDTSARWSYKSDVGLIYFTDGSTFHSLSNDEGAGNWRITYSYGYAVASVPSELKILCADIVQILKTRFEKNLAHIKSQAFETHSTVYAWKLIPDDMRDLIMSYKGRTFV